MKNQAFYQQLEADLAQIASKIDEEKLRAEHQDIIDFVGSCPLSCNDVIEALQQGDCMCLALDIARSEQTIQDPSTIVIKDIIPTFMTADSFVQSAVFNISKQGDQAHSGFDAEGQGALALGLGREQVSGVLPLALFKEHWELAQKKGPPVFGFMCTLDTLGY